MVAATVALLALTGLAESGRHTVKKGETLAQIARAYGTSVEALAQANGLANRNLIIAGTVLVIPGPGGAAAPAPAGTYVVKPGDTLATIGRRYGVTSAALAQANGITNPNRIRVGTTLVIPGAAAPAAAPSAPAPAPAGTYVVKPGDTLATIGRRYGVTSAALAQANGITNPNRIRAGTTLVIPGTPPAAPAPAPTAAAAPLPGGAHLVAAGETLTTIARRYGVSVEALAAVNGITPPAYRIYAGTRLLLVAVPAAPSLACPVPGASFFNDWGFPRSGGRFHEGNDLFAPMGTPVLAPASGSVVHSSGPIGGHQFRLTAADGTLYVGSHMSGFGQAGQVAAGTVVGYVGNTGNAAGARPHLHFEIHPGGGAAVNPYPAVDAAC